MWVMNVDLYALGVDIISLLSCISEGTAIPCNLLTAKSIKMRSGISHAVAIEFREE